MIDVCYSLCSRSPFSRRRRGRSEPSAALRAQAGADRRAAARQRRSRRALFTPGFSRPGPGRRRCGRSRRSSAAQYGAPRGLAGIDAALADRRHDPDRLSTAPSSRWTSRSLRRRRTGSTACSSPTSRCATTPWPRCWRSCAPCPARPRSRSPGSARARRHCSPATSPTGRWRSARLSSSSSSPS